MYRIVQSDYLIHHGVKGMKWGVRRDEWENSRRAHNQNVSKFWKEVNDRNLGSLNKRKYSKETKKISKQIGLNKTYKESRKNFDKYQKEFKKAEKNRSEANKEYTKLRNLPSSNKKLRVNTKNGERYRYQKSTVQNKNGTFTEYTVDVKRLTAVGQKYVRKYTHGGLGAKTLSQAKLSQKDYDYIENKLLKDWGYR